jgi:casein kinase II subunit alpha
MPLISLIFGHHWHIFKLKDVEPDDVIYGFWVLVEQVRRFGPVPLSYEEIANEERLGILTSVINYVNENRLQLPFSMSEDEELSREDRDFIMRMMKLDPSDSPTAKELLQDEWFKS